MPGKAIKSTNKKGGKHLSTKVGSSKNKSALNGSISTSLNKKVANKQKEKEKRTKDKSRRQEHDPDKTYEISEIGPVYLDWAKRRTKNSKGKIVRELYLKKSNKHRIWVKWADEFNDEYEKGPNPSKWSAESQDKFEGSGMKKLVQEALDKKIVWPWPKLGEDGSDEMLKILKAGGYKEWINPKANKDEKWRLDYKLEFNTDTSGLSESDDTDSTSGTEKEDEDENEEDEV